MSKTPRTFKEWWRVLVNAPKLAGPWQTKKAMDGTTIWYRESPVKYAGDIVRVYGPFADEHSPGDQVWRIKFANGMPFSVPGIVGLDEAKAKADDILSHADWILCSHKDLGWTTPDETENWGGDQ